MWVDLRYRADREIYMTRARTSMYMPLTHLIISGSRCYGDLQERDAVKLSRQFKVERLHAPAVLTAVVCDLDSANHVFRLVLCVDQFPRTRILR